MKQSFTNFPIPQKLRNLPGSEANNPWGRFKKTNMADDLAVLALVKKR